MVVPKVEEIKEQLSQILKEVAKKQKINNFEILLELEGNYGDGFLGEFFRGEVLNKDNGEVTRVAVKRAPSLEYDYTKIYKNEFSFYETAYPVFASLQKTAGVSEPFDNVAKYFCGSLEAKREFVAMENLISLGYVMHDKTQYLDKEHLEGLFKIYGKFHAISYVLQKTDLEKYQKITENFSNLFPMMATMLGDPFVLAISASVNSLNSLKDKRIYDEIKDLRENVVENYLKACIYNGEHRVLIHGDCWSNNMLFKYSESGKLLDMKLIDFQISHVSSPIYDLSYFFYSGASKQEFDNLESYLQLYYTYFSKFVNKLGANIDEILSFEELKNEWKENALFGTLVAIYLWGIKLLPKESIKDAVGSKNDDQDSKTWDEARNRFQKLQEEKVYNNDSFKEKTTDILRHAFEYGIITKDKIVRKVQ